MAIKTSVGVGGGGETTAVSEFCNDWTCLCVSRCSVLVRAHAYATALFLFALSTVITSNDASVTQRVRARACVCVCVCPCAHVSAVCLFYFHVSHLVIGMPVTAVAAMQWHMPAPWLPDWQGGCCGEIKRMLEQITPRPLPSLDWQMACRLALPTLSLPFATRFYVGFR